MVYLNKKTKNKPILNTFIDAFQRGFGQLTALWLCFSIAKHAPQTVIVQSLATVTMHKRSVKLFLQTQCANCCKSNKIWHFMSFGTYL